MENLATQTSEKIEPVVKELKIYKVKNTALYTVKYAGGGQLPAELEGRYTSIKLAQEKIDYYLSKKNK